MNHTTEEQALLNTIHAKPLDLAPKLVYADWLEEHDNPIGECLRDVATCEAKDFANGNNPLAKHDAITLMEACRLVFPPVGRINTLAAKQTAMLPVFRDAWMNVGLGCGGYDLGLVKQFIGEAYQVAGLKPPEVFVELPSPLHGLVMASVGSSVRASVRDAVLDSAMNSVLDSVLDSVLGSVRNVVLVSVLDLVIDSDGCSVGTPVLESVLDLVRASVRASANINDAFKYILMAGYGLHDSHFLGYYSTLSAFGLRSADKLHPLMKLATQIGWWWPFENAVIITPRPQSITMDGKRLVEVKWQDFTVKGK